MDSSCIYYFSRNVDGACSGRMQKCIRYVIVVCLLVTGITLLQEGLIQYGAVLDFANEDTSVKDEVFREMHLSGKVLSDVMENNDCKSPVTWMYWREAGGSYRTPAGEYLQKRFGFRLLPEVEAARYAAAYETVLLDIGTFPVMEDKEGRYGWTYEDSWGNARSYGGRRRHEGTDIMAENNERGYFAVVSASDGIVEKRGWLEQGGYRIGIRSPKGAYYYYAHLYDYAAADIGDKVKAGDILGYMGDTGYSKVEGTTGNFPVHLHFGIYLDLDNTETSVNPYYILRYVEEREKK